MSCSKLGLKFVTILLSVFVAGVATAQPRPLKQAKPTKQANQSPEDRSRNIKSERGDAYRRCFPARFAAYANEHYKLKTNEEREQRGSRWRRQQSSLCLGQVNRLVVS